MFLRYLLWAIVQQSLVVFPFYVWMFDFHGLIYSMLIFSFVFHLGNSKLTMLTLLLAVLMYPLIFNISIYFIILTILIHALVGSLLKYNRFDLRVWRFK